MAHQKIYQDFLGVWELEPDTCIYQQSEPPRAGHYIISEVREGLNFQMSWTDASGEEQTHSFTGVPDGDARPFAGGELADSLSVSAPSVTELNTAAYFKDRELMSVKRVLLPGGTHMEVLQAVHLPDGTTPTNIARYCRRLHS